MSYIFIITKDGMKLIDGRGMVNPQNGTAVATWARDAANNSAPVIGDIPDAQLFTELVNDLAYSDVNAYVRDSIAAILETLAGVFALPLGPLASLGADQAFSEAFKNGYDAAGRWSAQHDWSPFLDEIEKITGVSHQSISPTVTSDFLAARNFVISRDLLVLDLDGDGLELAGASGAVLFEHPHRHSLRPAQGLAGCHPGHRLCKRWPQTHGHRRVNPNRFKCYEVTSGLRTPGSGYGAK